MMVQNLFLLALTLTVALVQGEYFKVESETCSQLQNSTAFFDFLLPCASYSADKVDLNCLTADQTQKALTRIPQWTYVPNSQTGDAIKKSFVFNDFQEAFLFMASSAQLAEKNQHHPDWRNLWNTVDVTLTTDDKACLSSFDIELAEGMDQLFKAYGKK